METPQFQTQDDWGVGTGISPIPQWQLAARTAANGQDPAIHDPDVDPAIRHLLACLRSIFHSSEFRPLTSTELHDLTGFVLHRLLLLPSLAIAEPKQAARSECLRYGAALYMLEIHGTTYYSHAQLANNIMTKLAAHLKTLTEANEHHALGLWAITVGMVAAVDPIHRRLFIDAAFATASALRLQSWGGVLIHLRSILWVEVPQVERFRQEWDNILQNMTSQVH
jgi:hypothetical protein